MGRYGWVRDLPDKRDRLYSVRLVGELPRAVDLRALMPKVYDQGQIGSCVAQSVAGALQYLQNKGDVRWKFTPSRLFIYYNARVALGTVMIDSGAMIRDGVKSVNKQGVCPEDSGQGWSWPYSDNKIQFRIKPWTPCYKNALGHKSIEYSSVPQNMMAIKTALAEGYPVIFGFTVYESIEQASQTGDIPMPGPQESVLGGHAILIVGYDDETKRFLFRNSWGEGWGNKGYGTIPYNYVVDPNLSSDFWVIKSTN